MASVKARNCVRCRQPLPEGSCYCVGCGCSNEGVFDDKVVTINKQYQQRQTWEMFCRIFPFLRLFK